MIFRTVNYDLHLIKSWVFVTYNLQFHEYTANLTRLIQYCHWSYDIRMVV